MSNIDRLIKKIEKNFNSVVYQGVDELGVYYEGYEDANQYVISVLKEYKKNEILEIPQAVADWIKWCKKADVCLSECLDWDSQDGSAPNEYKEYEEWVSEYRKSRENIVAKSWIDGYTVKKEGLQSRDFGKSYTSCRIGISKEGE